MSNWDILGDDSVSTSANDDVEYVGMADDEDVPQVRVPRRPVRRVSRAAATIPAPRANRQARPLAPKNGKEPLFYMPTESGAELAVNADALQNMHTGGLHDVGGRTALRVQPGTYVTYGPGRGPSGHLSGGMGGGMGTNGLYDEIIATQTPTTPNYDYDFGTDPTVGQNGGNGFDIGGLVGGIGTGIGEMISAIGQTVVGSRRQREEAEIAREQMRLEDEAARDARSVAEREAQREHELTLERIRQRQEELEELQRTGAALEERRGAYPAAPPAVGVSPVVWVLLAVLGIGGIGGVIWFATRKKEEREERV